MPDTTHDRVKELTRQLETGIQDLYASGRYREYLSMLSKFHKYSYGNVPNLEKGVSAECEKGGAGHPRPGTLSRPS